YGGGIQHQLELAAGIDIPIAFHFGENDKHIGADAVDAVRNAFAGRDNVRIDTYGGADHGFNCWGRTGYHQNAAALAHGRSLAFLATHLG
ncbi:MAG: dienelactone hydrolase family protein, partial [Burkholderiaceae bacterium]